jgi:hypothetical protein
VNVDQEMPKYTVVKQLGRDMQIRRYAQAVAVEADVSGGINSPSNGNAFQDLAGYIGVNPLGNGGKNERKESISMTSPVVNFTGDDGVTKQQFILPAENQSDAPIPTSDKVRLVNRGERYMAVRTFRGGWSDRNFERNKKTLTDTLQTNDIKHTGKWE